MTTGTGNPNPPGFALGKHQQTDTSDQPDAPRSPRVGERLYARHARAADRAAWSVERDIRWTDVDSSRGAAEHGLLSALRDAALIEAYHPVHLQRMLLETWDDVDAGVICSLELYEGFKHFHALRMYLDAVGHEPSLTDADIVAMRHAAREAEDEGYDIIERLVEFMLSEHLASYFFRRAADQTSQPVLAELLGLIAADEVRHAQSASDLIARRIDADAGVIPRVLRAAAHFRHFGERAVGSVPVALPGDPIAIETFARRIERLCGTRLVDHLKEEL